MSKRLIALLATFAALLIAALPVGGQAQRAEAAPADPVVAAAPATFSHPGVLVSRPQLDFVRGRVQAGAQPWTNAFNQMMGSRYADQARTPRPRAIVECGSYSNPNNGCTDEREDAAGQDAPADQPVADQPETAQSSTGQYGSMNPYGTAAPQPAGAEDPAGAGPASGAEAESTEGAMRR